MRRIVGVLVCIWLAGCGDPAGPGWPPGTYRIWNWSQTVTFGSTYDVLFVIDNSASMSAKQPALIASLPWFAEGLEAVASPRRDHHIAVITTGMMSDACPSCDGQMSASCLNPTGESGRFQDRIGGITWVDGQPVFDHQEDPGCRIDTKDHRGCFFDPATGRGTALVGVNGCAYPRGLAAVHGALGEHTHGNAGFLREDATLVVIVISGGEDCGEVGDVAESIAGTDAKICSYAAKGLGPDGGTFHPDDPESRPYRLSPVRETYDFLMALKGGREGMVKFAAITGITDVSDLSSTRIEYQDATKHSEVIPACRMPDCTGDHCSALPGTRYLRLAEMFGLGINGFVDTICQEDFTPSMGRLGDFVGCPRAIALPAPPRDPDLVALLLNDEALPAHSCTAAEGLERCQGPDDTGCSPGICARSWVYDPSTVTPEPDAKGGRIRFADHFDPCDQPDRNVFHFELVYVAE